MENRTPEMEQRIWQRVLAQPGTPQSRQDRRVLLLAALETAAVCKQLAGSLSGRTRELLQQLYRGEMDNVACLKGMSVLDSSTPEKLPVLSAPKEPDARALEKCYHRSRHAIIEYTARSADPEFGAVFSHMADRERVHCALLAELIGRLN